MYFNDVAKEKEQIAAGNMRMEEEQVEKQAILFNGSRVSVLENYLNSANDSTQIKFSVSNPDDPKNTGSKPVFRIIYSLNEE